MGTTRFDRRAAALLAVVAFLQSASTVFASTGVSVDIGRLDITQVLTPGAAYKLPTIGVRNPGTERTPYVMVANPVQDPGRNAPPTAWFEFEPATLELDPGETQAVKIRIVLPTDAQPGDYIALVGAQIAAKGGGATVGAAAAARTTFTIQPSSDLQALGIWLGRVFSDLLPWSAIVPAVVVLAGLVWFIRRRFSFRIGIERRGPSAP